MEVVSLAEIKPFRGVLYNINRFGGLEDVTAPPYDVISPELQDDLYSRNPKNIVRLILGKSLYDDVPGNDKYSRALYNLTKWLQENSLVRDANPSIYYYTQSYRLADGTELTRKGFIALARIEEFGTGKIHAHEQTLAGPKADRLRLMQTCKANFSSIFSLYSDPDFAINRTLGGVTEDRKPTVEVVDDEKILNRLWRIDDPEVVNSVVKAMKDRPLFIADGHHRYETALNYKKLRAESGSGVDTVNEPYNYVMMYFSNMDDEGITIGPTHRVIHGIENFEEEPFLNECKKYFNIEEFKCKIDEDSKERDAFIDRLQSAANGLSAFGLALKGSPVCCILTLKSAETMASVFGDSIPEVFKSLDVTVLHVLILSKILGITREAQEAQENINYYKSYQDACSAMSDEKKQLLFLLNPTRMEQVKAVAEAGLVMPQKSTFFYPKLLSGLVINILFNYNIEGTPA
jgi:uncharacterized protein (DUF1015 family)